MTIAGMHCESCAEGITETLRASRGVLATDVHFSNTVQIVDFDANKLSRDEVVALITNDGFTVSLQSPN